MKSFTINASWLALAPHMRMDARYWEMVVVHLRKALVDPEKATLDEVRDAMARVALDVEDRRRRVRHLRNGSKTLGDLARALERSTPEGSVNP